MTADPGIAKGRVETLIDGIYAIAMTLLVLTIDVPVVPAGVSPDVALPALVLGLDDQVLACLIAFLVLTGFWMAHEEIFQRVARINRTFLNLNLLVLLSTVFVPFTTWLVADYSTTRLAIDLFALNLAVIGLLFAGQWLHLSRHPALLHAPLPDAVLRRGLLRSLSTTVAAVVAVLIAVPMPDSANWGYLMIPLILIVADRLPDR